MINNISSYLSAILVIGIFSIFILQDDLDLFYSPIYYSGERDYFHSEYIIEEIAEKQWYIGGTLLPNSSQCASIDQIPYGSTVFLNSSGGNVDTGICMARAIHKKRLDTVVQNPHMCASACVWLFLAGDDRTLIGDAKIGIHSPGISAQFAFTMYPLNAIHAGVYMGYQVRDMMNDIGVDKKLSEFISIWVPNYTIHHFDYSDFDGDPEIPDIPLLKGIATHYINFWGYTNDNKSWQNLGTD